MENSAPMIPRIVHRDHVVAWQREMARAVTHPRALCQLLELETLPDLNGSAQEHDFPLRVPHPFIRRMRRADPDDPLLLQVLPQAAESMLSPGYCTDPLSESAHMVAPGVLQKYRGRILLTVTAACGIHCRYCFRRHFPYAEANPTTNRWQHVLDVVATDDTVHEIILSGGDPLTLSDARLAELVTRLESISHLKRLRIHTRMPIVLPERVDDRLIDWLSETRLQPIMVVHVNHPNEIDEPVTRALAALRGIGVTLLNQAVLLRRINNNAETLARLSETLFDAGVLPYYLHQLDPVQGAAHFEVPDFEAQRIMNALHAVLPGYMVPRLVRETPGAPGKTSLWPTLNAPPE